MSKIKSMVSKLYTFFLIYRQKVVNPFLIGVLLLSLLIGAGYRIISIQQDFEISNGFEYHVNMASYFWTDPGGFNFEGGSKMKEKPDDYVFSRHPKEPATGSFENEKGWQFILSLIFKEGTKGIQNLAMTVVMYQLMLDLLVIVLLFYSGKSMAGPLGGSLAAILYAVFKPSISMVSWVSYYYWTIPFSALSLVFWTVIYKPEERTYSLKFSSLLFFLYGMLMGFATSLRLSFLFLPLFLSPLIFFREWIFKRALVLLLAMFIGQGILLLPQIFITYKYYDKFTLSVRGKWHTVISGLGAYPNPFGVKDSGDITTANWAVERGGPELNKVGFQEYDKFMKKQAIRLFREKPDIFLRNFKSNLYSGITMTSDGSERYAKGPAFYRLMDNDKDIFDPKNNHNILKFAYSFPLLALFAIFIILFYRRESFNPFVAVILQGLYLLGILCVYFPPAYQHTAAYFPVFVLILAVAGSILTKVVFALPEGAIRCWVNGNGIKIFPQMIKECFREDWDKEYNSEKTRQESSAIKLRLHPAVKWLFVFSCIVILITGIVVSKGKKDFSNDMPDGRTAQVLNNILNQETNGNFELWSNGEFSAPDEWGFLHGKGGKIRKDGEEENVKFGSSSVEIMPSSFKDSKLFFVVDRSKLYYLIDKTITITAWVRSNNNVTGKIYISLYTGINMPQHIAYYQNSGKWEKLTLTYKIPDDIATIAIFLNIDSDADAPAYFDGIGMKAE